MGNLKAEEFHGDSRLADAREQLLSILNDHARKITGIKEADPERENSFEETLAAFGNIRGNSLYYPYLGSGLGNGPFVELADGSVKYDFIIGIGVHFFGHNHPDITRALVNAALADTVMQGNLQQNADSYEISRRLCQLANKNGAALDHCFLTTSGAMANENALKILFQKGHPRDRVLAFEHCFMGRTMTLAQITDKEKYREGLPENLAVDYIPFMDPDDPKGSTLRAMGALKKHLMRRKDKHVCMVMELVQGEGGYYPGTRDFFMELVKILEKHKIPLMIDEIQTFGRTSEPFAFQHFGLDDHVDVVTIGKLSQICATLYKKDFNPKPGLISQTFTSSSSAIAAAGVILDHFENGDCFGESGRNMELGHYFAEKLQALSDKTAGLINGPFGIGAMVAFTPLNGSPECARHVAHCLFENGVIAFIAGSAPARVRFLLPTPVTEISHIDEVCAIIERSLTQAERTLDC